jgi:hypothetical protein
MLEGGGSFCKETNRLCKLVSDKESCIVISEIQVLHCFSSRCSSRVIVDGGSETSEESTYCVAARRRHLGHGKYLASYLILLL